ncbi:glycine cleavage system aminomethyltransferase GcvT [Radiobacillus deserti]|uniref:Aminomethyltransferase n=1 Tax=Radiobacillus deserti TaxID=2594883 RepID=A0A516KGR7_9BACI|nr:glycine cleavage system aminomethyltransferase GcvT [Radiobacillus deserti]QDP40585.1 glycine cleavage system aminomethyltransferase GcvT [Radiobacillus deserti]
MPDLKRTPVYPVYEKYGAKTIDFGGWDLPVQFSGIKKEHEATRNVAGLFDVSHMGEIMVEGPKSEHFLQKMLTNDVAKLSPKKAQYTVMCYETGGTVDDLIVYMLEESKYLLVVNAANTDKDFDWLLQHQIEGVTITNVSSEYVQLALQGPKAEQVLQSLTETELSTIRFFTFESPVYFTGIDQPAIVSRTGYTGEDGFEIYVDTQAGTALWDIILGAGKEIGVEPIGLGARDTLRFEANLALYGQELSKDISPIEAGIGFAVKTDKEADFIGKAILKEQKEKGTKRKLVGIEMMDKGIPRHGYKVYAHDEEIGFVTTGTQSPTLKKNIGLALLNTDFTELETEVFVEVRNKRLKAKVVETPFYKRKN